MVSTLCRIKTNFEAGEKVEIGKIFYSHFLGWVCLGFTFLLHRCLIVVTSHGCTVGGGLWGLWGHGKGAGAQMMGERRSDRTGCVAVGILPQPLTKARGGCLGLKKSENTSKVRAGTNAFLDATHNLRQYNQRLMPPPPGGDISRWDWESYSCFVCFVLGETHLM